MYSVILATMLAMGSDAPNFGHHHRGHGCHGCWGCHGCHGCHGGGYAFGCHGCHGCWGGGCSGCHGCWGGGCSGCYGGCWGGCYGSVSYGCSGCYGCLGGVWGCYGCYGGCSGFAASPAISYGCHGCFGGYAAAAPVVAAPAVAVQAPAVSYGAVASAPVAVGASPQVDDLNRRLQRLENLIERALKGKGATGQEEVRADAAPAKITVNLPADARLWVDNVECPLTSAVRSFNTPALEPGKSYFYTMKVAVNRNGQPVFHSERVRVAAGRSVTVDLTDVDRLATARR